MEHTRQSRNTCGFKWQLIFHKGESAVKWKMKDSLFTKPGKIGCPYANKKKKELGSILILYKF